MKPPAARAGGLSGSFAPLVLGACLAAAAALYVGTAVRALGHPLNTGADLLWAGLWLFFAALVLASRALLGPAPHAALWQSVIVAAALAMTVFSRQGIAVLVALWILALAGALGDWLLARLGAESAFPLDHACLAVALGLPLLAFLALGLALAGVLSAPWILAALILLTSIRAPFLWTRLRRNLRGGAPRRRSRTRDSLPERGTVLALLGFVALINLAWALAPEIQYDALNYQLAVPSAYVAEHRLVNLPIYWHSYFAHLFNVVFTLALALHGAAAAKLLVYATGLFAALAAYALGRSLFHERVGLWAAALFYTAPLAGWLSSTAYVDLPVTLFFTASVLALQRWRETRTAGWIGASGLLAGAALGTKLTALCAAVSLLAVIVFLLWREAGLSPARKAGALAAFLAGLGLIAAPWYSIAFAFTGNPFFPLFNGVFRSPGWDPVNTNLNAGLFGIGTSAVSLLRLPFALTFDTGRFGEATPDGAVGLALALLPAGVVFGWKALAGKRFLVAIAGFYLLLWAFNVQYARYFIPLLPLVCVLAVAALASVPRPRLLRVNLAIVGAVLLVQVPLHFPQYWNIRERVPVPLAFGLETREAFLGRALGGIYDAVQHVNTAARPGEKVLTGGAESMRFYLKAPLASMSETFALKRICDALPPPRLARTLLENGYAWLLVNGEIDPNRPDPFSSPVFLRRFATLEFQRGAGRVYRIHAEESAGAATNLLENPGFETLDLHGRPLVWAANGRPVVVRGSEARTGDAALLSDPENFVSQPVAVEAGSRYLLRHWTRAAQPGSSARLQVNWLDRSSRMLDASIAVVPASPQWASHEMLVTAPPEAATAVVFASVHEGGKVLFDDFSFTAAGEAPR